MTNTPGQRFKYCPDVVRSSDFLQTRTLREKCFQIKCDISFGMALVAHSYTYKYFTFIGSHTTNTENIFGTDSYQTCNLPKNMEFLWIHRLARSNFYMYLQT